MCGIVSYSNRTSTDLPDDAAAGWSFSEVEVTRYTACALDTSSGSGVLVCWGHDYGGSLTPPGGTSTSSDIVQVAAGREHFCAVDASGVAHCWGPNTENETLVPYGSHSFVQVDAGRDHSCGVTSDGGMLCWGDDSAAQLGDYAWRPGD